MTVHPSRLRTALALLLGSISLIGCGHANGGSDSKPKAEPPESAPPAADPCEGACQAPEECLQYVGIGGPRIPLFACGIACTPGATPDGCPAGQACFAIADGPTRCEPTRTGPPHHHDVPDTAGPTETSGSGP